MHILQSLEEHLSAVQSVIFFNNFSDVSSLIFGARENKVSVAKYTEQLHLLFRVELFFRL